MKKLLVLFLTALLTLSLTGCAPEVTTDTEGSDGESVNYLTVMAEQGDGWVRNFNLFAQEPQYMSGFMYEPLVIFDTLNGNAETMWLAEDIISEPDNKTLTIKVRQGIKWSDGEDFNAEDVAFSFTYSKDHPAIDKTGAWGENGIFEDVVIIDDYTVQIIMKEENRFHRNTVFAFKWMVPEHIFSQIENPESYILEEPVVTGAFSEVISFTPEMVQLGANPTYWKADELEVDELRVPQYNSNDAALALLATGSVDWAHIFIPNIEETYIKGDETRQYWYGQNDAVRIAFNYMSENEDNLKAFNDPIFKQALSLAVDRQGIIDSAVYGYLVNEVPTNTGLPPALHDVYKDDASYEASLEYTTYDLEKAKQMLADAGYVDVDGDGFVENPDGTPIEFEIISPAGWTDWNDGATIAAEGMRAIGVNVVAKAIDLSLVIESWETGGHDALYTAYGNSSDIYRYYFDSLGDQSRALTSTWWSITQNNYLNDEITALVSQLPNATEEEVMEITKTIETHFAENMINIPVLYNGNWFVYNTSRFTGWATDENPFVQPALVTHDTKILQLLALEPVE